MYTFSTTGRAKYGDGPIFLFTMVLAIGRWRVEQEVNELDGLQLRSNIRALCFALTLEISALLVL